MRMSWTTAVMALCLVGPGCSFYPNVARNLTIEPGRVANDHRFFKRSEAQAKEAWKQVERQYPEPGFSCDYRDGFIVGFVDYIDFGGNGEPPAVPPIKYRKEKYSTPAGYHGIEEWFMGFRHGAATAQASGLRELVTLPVVIPADPNTALLNPADPGASGQQQSDPAPPTPEPEVTLPAPRVTPPAAKPPAAAGAGPK